MCWFQGHQQVIAVNPMYVDTRQRRAAAVLTLEYISYRQMEKRVCVCAYTISMITTLILSVSI